jgi:tetratricopeptide (TPR) repeat protein
MEITGNRGILHLYGLTDWWNINFSEKEKIILSENYTIKYDPNYLGIHDLDINILTESNIVVFNLDDDFTKINFKQKAFFIQQSSVISFLMELACCVNWSNGSSAYDKIYNKIEDLIENVELPILDIHFFYMNQIGRYFSGRDLNSKNYEKLIHYCKKQVEIAPKAAAAFSKIGSDGFIPSHTGFKRLAIIFEKEKKYQEAIFYCQQALTQGWNGDWEHRIKRMQIKLNKMK